MKDGGGGSLSFKDEIKIFHVFQNVPPTALVARSPCAFKTCWSRRFRYFVYRSSICASAAVLALRASLTAPPTALLSKNPKIRRWRWCNRASFEGKGGGIAPLFRPHHPTRRRQACRRRLRPTHGGSLVDAWGCTGVLRRTLA